MTAYGAVLSLRNTIYNILNCSRFSLDGRSQRIIQVVIKELQPRQEILKRLDETGPSRSRKKVNALDGRIKEAIWRFEDSLESLLIQQIHSQLETLPEIVSIDLQSLQNAANSLIQKLKDMEKDYVYEVENMPQEEPISSSIGFRGTNSKMIGLSDQFQQLKADLVGDRAQFRFHRLIGTAGVGKTMLAMQIYQDPEIHSKFECRAWVTVGRVPQPFGQILQGILAQLCGIGITQGDEEIDYSLRERLRGKNCLIVLDDVWEADALSRMHFFEDIPHGCIHVLLTSRHRKLKNDNLYSDIGDEVWFLDEEESMELLCDKVFQGEICPPQLHKAAFKIAKLCEGLPLLIVTVARIISESEHNKDPVYWNDVAEGRNSDFKNAYKEISKVLFPSYDYLPQDLKIIFLFMGVFPRDYDTPPSKIIIMLIAEGLLSWYKGGCKYLKELAYDYSLVLRILKSVDKGTLDEFQVTEFKSCWLHSSWRHVCREEASKNKFYHVLNKLTNAEEEGQRGLCLENNMLFGIKYFRDSVRSNCASFARSLLFYGPYHQYPIHIDVGFMLLREIDALTQRFYTFPIEILTLVQLKYLAITCNGEVPSTISKLFNLRVLIIHPHMKIRRRGSPSYVPIQVWDMQKLEHIDILGKNLVAPSHVVSLEKLSTLVGVNASICTISKLPQRIPNIKKLGIQIELTPYDDHINLLSCFDCISTLERLETFKLSITNPVIKKSHVFPVTDAMLKLPRNLKKLHLSGMGFPWEYMNDIASLPYLEALKLRSYAFQGPHWIIKDRQFPCLRFLLIEESDLVQMISRHRSLLELRNLSVKHCYKLEAVLIPFLFNHLNLEIEFEDCNPLAVTGAIQLQPREGAMLRVTSSSSFDEKPTTTKFERHGTAISQNDDDKPIPIGENTSNHGGTGEVKSNEEIANPVEVGKGEVENEEHDDKFMDAVTILKDVERRVKSQRMRRGGMMTRPMGNLCLIRNEAAIIQRHGASISQSDDDPSMLIDEHTSNHEGIEEVDSYEDGDGDEDGDGEVEIEADDGEFMDGVMRLMDVERIVKGQRMRRGGMMKRPMGKLNLIKNEAAIIQRHGASSQMYDDPSMLIDEHTSNHEGIEEVDSYGDGDGSEDGDGDVDAYMEDVDPFMDELERWRDVERRLTKGGIGKGGKGKRPMPKRDLIMNEAAMIQRFSDHEDLEEENDVVYMSRMGIEQADDDEEIVNQVEL